MTTMAEVAVQPVTVAQPRSLYPKWLSGLTLQQQAVLGAATRGQDGDVKYTMLKEIMWAMRASTMKAAHTGQMLKLGDHVPSFMTLQRFDRHQEWENFIKQALDNEGDGCILHYYTHLMHAVQVLAYKHPDPTFRDRWMTCYLLMVKKLHLEPESEATMDKRLGDWDRDTWEPEDANTGS